MKSKIPSPRQLNLKRFDRPDFRATTKRGKRAAGWTWSRAVYRLKRWLTMAHADLNNALDRQLDPFRALVRALQAIKLSPRRPDLDARNKRAEQRARTTAEWATVRQVMRSSLGEPHPARGIATGATAGRQESAPSRLSMRRTGAHRLDNLKTLPHQAYMLALDARQQYVIANLLRLKGLATTRAFGEPSWREQRRADHYATA